MTQKPVVEIDFDHLASWMDDQGLDTGPVENVRYLAGGTQNVLCRFTRGGRDFVLRRPPPSPRPSSNRTMEREAQVLAALKSTDVPHPGLIAACSDHEVLGVSFYLMEPVEGFNATNGTLPEPHRSDPALRRGMGFALIDGIAALHRVDYKAAGLEGFGKPEGYVSRQVDRWLSQLADYERLEGWPGPTSIPNVQDVADWLRENEPPQSPTGILHGDYQFANVMYRPEGSGLAAIVDWELATIGDPLVDLGWLVACYADSGGPQLPTLRISPWDGFPPIEELVEHYANHSTRDISHVVWYVVLACFRLGIILEGTHARACAGKAPKETGDLLHAMTIALFGRATFWIERGRML